MCGRHLLLWAAISAVEAMSGSAWGGEAESSLPEPQARLIEALEQKGDFVFRETPLAEVAKHIEATFKVPVRIDDLALDDVGLTRSLTVTFDVEGITLHSALALMTDLYELAWLAEDDVLVITTPEEAQAIEYEQVRPYDVCDLVQVEPGLPWPEEDYDHDSLAEVIMMIEPNTWDTGSGGSACWVAPFRGTLTFDQSQRVHGKVGLLLAALRAGLGRSGPPIKVLRPVEVAAEAAIEKSLARPADFQFHETPLAEALAMLETKYGIEIVMDRGGLLDENVVADTPISFDGSSLTAAAALTRMLATLGLTSVTRDEVLMVTSRDGASEYHEMVVYPIADLMRPAAPWYAEDDAQSLADVMRVALSGELEMLNVMEFRDLLVCESTEAKLKKVDQILGDLRQLLKDRAEGKEAAHETKLFVSAYGISDCSGARLPAKEIETLAKAIEELIEPETWETAGGEGKIRAVPGGLVVRQVPRVHAQIRVLCDELDWSVCRGGFGGSGAGLQGGSGGNPAGQGGGMF